ncbi:hypothetical protein, partial [Actinoallomurus acaciae]
MTGPFAGVDVGGTNIRVAVGTPEDPGPARRAPVPAGYDDLLDRVIALLGDCCRDAGLSPADLTGVGVGLPGVAGGGTATFVPALPY